jgi:sirohydrochlorin cobaltochelatase
MKTAVVLVGHGSRVERSNIEFEKVAAEFSRRHPQYDVSFAYVELVMPTLDQALRVAAENHEVVVALPLFLFAAGHVKKDIPSMLEPVRQNFLNVKFILAQCLGADARLAKALDDRLLEKDSRIVEEARDYTVVVIGRGSSDKSANLEFVKLLALLQEGREYAQVQATYIAVSKPQVPETLDLISKIPPKRLLVVPYLLFDGILVHRMNKLVEEFASKYIEIDTQMASYIGFHEAVYEVLEERLNKALKG